MTDAPERKWPVGGYAPGNYACICSVCDQRFIGDKRARECHDCVIQAQKSRIAELEAALAQCRSLLIAWENAKYLTWDDGMYAFDEGVQSLRAEISAILTALQGQSADRPDR